MKTPQEPSTSLVTRATAGAHGRVEAQRLAPPTPGQYWRAARAIPARCDRRGKHNAVEEGTVLMIKEIERADGQEHVIKLAAHPGWPKERQSDLHFHADDFERSWVRALDGAQLRELEVAELAEEMRLTQQALASPPPSKTPVAMLTQQPAPNLGGETGRELATEEGLSAMAQYATQLQEQAQNQIEWIKEKTGDLSEQAGAMARYHQERATALLANANQQLSDLSGVLATVKNLTLYTGDGVGVMQLVDGAPAPSDVPLTIYQDFLSFDEELLLRLDSGGLDHTMTAEVAAALADPALAEQMIPSARGMVLVRYRRTHKEFIQVGEGADLATSFAAAQANASMSEESMRHRLLYRDGARFFLIECDEVLPNIKQLLPTTQEQSSYFTRKEYNWETRTYDYDPITSDDLAYASAQRKQRDVLTDYARVLIVLWGLHDRTSLFDGWDVPKFCNWLEPSFQAAYLRLVSHDSLMEAERPDFAEFRQQHNAHLASGTTVAVHIGQLFDTDSAPTCWRYDGKRDYATRMPVDRVVVARVKTEAGKPYISIATQKRYHDDDKPQQTKLYLTRSSAFLVLDRVRSADLSYYLTSRKARQRYEEFVQLFRVALAHVQSREAEEAPWRAWLETSILEGGLSSDMERVRQACHEALSVVRAASRTGALPSSPEAVPHARRRSILDAAHAALADQGVRIRAAKAWCARDGFTPLALVHAGSGAWYLYREATAAERDPRLANFPWVVRAAVTWDDNGAAAAGAATFELLRAEAGEQLIHEWPESAAWRKADAPEGLSHERVVALLDAVGSWSAVLDDTKALPDEWIQLAKEYARRDKSSSVARLQLDVPIGTVLRRGQPFVLTARFDAMHAAYSWGDRRHREEVEAWVGRTYKHPSHSLEALRGPVRPDLRLVALRVSGKRRDTPWLEDAQAAYWVPNEAEWMRERTRGRAAGDEPTVRLTSLAPAGARLFPWLIEHCERATPAA